jgi:L-aminopeptidase/D-esterase-like protein
VRDFEAGGLKPLPAMDKKAPVGSEALTALNQPTSFYGNVGAATGMVAVRMIGTEYAGSAFKDSTRYDRYLGRIQ